MAEMVYSERSPVYCGKNRTASVTRAAYHELLMAVRAASRLAVSTYHENRRFTHPARHDAVCVCMCVCVCSLVDCSGRLSLSPVVTCAVVRMECGEEPPASVSHAHSQQSCRARDSLHSRLLTTPPRARRPQGVCPTGRRHRHHPARDTSGISKLQAAARTDVWDRWEMQS